MSVEKSVHTLGRGGLQTDPDELSRAPLEAAIDQHQTLRAACRHDVGACARQQKKIVTQRTRADGGVLADGGGVGADAGGIDADGGVRADGGVAGLRLPPNGTHCGIAHGHTGGGLECRLEKASTAE